MELSQLKKLCVNTLLVKEDIGKLSTQLRMDYHYVLFVKNYKRITTMNENNKDNVIVIKNSIKELNYGYNLIQGA